MTESAQGCAECGARYFEPHAPDCPRRPGRRPAPAFRPDPLDTTERATLPVVPKRLVSFELTPDLERDGTMDAIMADLMAKVRAEDERLRRLLPDPPSGFEWKGVLQSHDPDFDFAHDRAATVFRIVYRLAGIPGTIHNPLVGDD